MSCGPVETRFRLLDARVGWSAARHDHLDGLREDAGVRLAPVHREAVGSEVWTRLLPARLARGCGPCDWYLVTPRPSRLLRRGACDPRWQPLWSPACDPGRLRAAVAVAAWQHRVAVADRDSRTVWVWRSDGGALLAQVPVPDAAALAFDGCGGLWVATGTRLARFSPSAEPIGTPLPLPAQAGRPLALAIDDDGGAWLLTKGDAGLRLWHAARGAHALQAATSADLLAATLPPTGLAAVTDAGFCFAGTNPAEPEARSCWSWYGREPEPGDIALPAPRALQASGSLATTPLDSGIPRCRWHRVQLDADVPPGTSLRVETATADAPGEPHPDDWRAAPAGALDFLVQQPPGRYLLLRLHFSGDRAHTPVLRQVRIEFPRSTSLESLPPVYRENPRAEDFTERFLALFDASLAELDEAIAQFPAALDVGSARTELLPWLGSFLDLALDPAWEPERARAILAALPRLYRQRGTVQGLRLAIRLVFDCEPVIQELAGERAWGILARGGGATLGAMRLFGRTRARFHLGRSSLGQAPIRSWGNPELDAAGTGAWRFRVLVPAGPRLASDAARQRLVRLVDSQKPAHTQATVRVGGTGLLLGSALAVGVDSVLGPLPPPVLGPAGNVRLARASVLRAARSGPRPALVLGSPVVTANQTILE